MTQVYCTDRHKDSEGHRRPCKHRRGNRCTKTHLHIHLQWDDDAYHTNQICADQEGPE